MCVSIIVRSECVRVLLLGLNVCVSIIVFQIFFDNR